MASRLRAQIHNNILTTIKTHHYIIFFVRPLHSKPGLGSYCWIQSNYYGRPIVLQSVRCDQAVDHEGSSLWSNVF